MTNLSRRFALLLTGLCEAIAARAARKREMAPLLLLLWGRLRRMAARFASLARRVEAGRLAAAPPRLATRTPGPHDPARRPPNLPRGTAWLIRLVPEAAVYGSQLRHLLADPAMAELLKAAPRAGRILRPLCRMLAVEPPPRNPPSPSPSPSPSGHSTAAPSPSSPESRPHPPAWGAAAAPTAHA